MLVGINASLRLSSPRLCKGFWRLSAFSQIPSADIWAFASALERSQEFLEVVGSGSEASDGCLGGLMRLLESFLDALGRSGPLQEASRTLRDDRERLKHYACNGLEASSQAYATQGTPQQPPEPSPQNIQIQQDYYSYKLTRIISLLFVEHLHASRLKASADFLDVESATCCALSLLVVLYCC